MRGFIPLQERRLKASADAPAKRRGGLVTGFTIIELLVVLALIGVLSVIVIANLMAPRAKARDAQRIADVNILKRALELYYLSNNGTYPAILSNLAPNQISKVPIDPQTGLGYFYSVASCAGYHLGVKLELGNPALGVDADSSCVFPGLSTDCVTAGAVDQCYDVVP